LSKPLAFTIVVLIVIVATSFFSVIFSALISIAASSLPGESANEGLACLGLLWWAPSILLGVLCGVYVWQKRESQERLTNTRKTRHVKQATDPREAMSAARRAISAISSWFVGNRPGAIGMATVLMGNVLFLVLVLSTRRALPDRVMGMLEQCLILAGTTMLVGVPLGIISLWEGPRKWVGAMVLALGLIPWFVYLLLVRG